MLSSDNSQQTIPAFLQQLKRLGGSICHTILKSKLNFAVHGKVTTKDCRTVRDYCMDRGWIEKGSGRVAAVKLVGKKGKETPGKAPTPSKNNNKKKKNNNNKNKKTISSKLDGCFIKRLKRLVLKLVPQDSGHT